MTTEAARPAAWRLNLWLFLATIASVFVTGADDQSAPTVITKLTHGAEFAGTLLTILVAHELGHYVAARIHKVDASLPFFIPLPILSPFGTMGAVIRMRGVIPTRRALLDIGASGPLAGLLFAIPLYAWGAAHSHYAAIAPGSGNMELGESLLLKLLDHFSTQPAPPGTELVLSPVAFGAWGGMFVTMINLIPVGQLDGGHVAYALFGPRQNKIAQHVHRGMLAFFFVVLGGHVARDLAAGLHLWRFGTHLANSTVWLVWFELLAILGVVSSRGMRQRDEPPEPGALSIRVRVVATLGLVVVASLASDHATMLLPIAFFAGLALLLAMERRGGLLRPNDALDHPPTGAAPLDKGRAAIAVLTLAMFILLFMPEPISM